MQAVPAGAQELGNKVLGTLGLLAGAQPGPGIYVAERLLFYSANDLVDRNGHSLPVGLDLDALANAVGVQATFELPCRSVYWNASLSVPAARIRLITENPDVSIDRFGFGDLYVQPVRLGWKQPRFDIVAGFSFYVPTPAASLGKSGGVGRGYWTYQFSLGGTAYLNREKTWHISELTSYDHNGHRGDIDLTRGDTVQFQGGAGAALGIVTLGVAGYGLWQVRDDRGAGVPQAVRGARDRAFGLGPEINVTLKAIRGRIIFRYCHDVAVKARPLGQIMVVGVTILAHR